MQMRAFEFSATHNTPLLQPISSRGKLSTYVSIYIDIGTPSFVIRTVLQSVLWIILNLNYSIFEYNFLWYCLCEKSGQLTYFHQCDSQLL